MAKLLIQKATTDVTLYVFIQDSSQTDGRGLTGLAFNSASLTCYYVRPLGNATQLTLATQTVTGAHSDGGFVEVSSTNMPGVYRLDLSDAICATGVNSVVVMLKGATNMAPVVLEIQLVSYNPNDSVRLGLTALPNAAADAAGGLPISDAGGLDLDTFLGRITGNVALASDLSTLQTSVNTIDDFLDTEVAAILADTNELQTDWANGGRLDLILDARASQASVDTIDDFLDTEVAAILADTNELQADWTNGGRLDLLIDAIKTKTDNLPTDPADASDIAAFFATVNTKLDTIDDFLDTEVAAILADTNELQTDWVDGGRLDLILDARASQASVDALDDYVDTEVAAIKAKTDQLTFTVAGQVDANDIDRTGYALTTTEHNNIADALLRRDWTAVGATAARSVLNALRFLRNKRLISAGVLHTTEEDDVTIAWSANLTTSPAADPITEIDPTS